MFGRIWATSEDGSIEYRSLTSDRLQEGIQVLQRAFFPHENICKAIGLATNPAAIAECDDMVRNIAKHGVSLVAIDKQTGKIAGIMLNKIQDKHTSSKEFYLDYIKKAKYPETRAIFQFLVDMEDSIDPFTPYNADCLMELVFLGVLPDFTRKSIGYKLCEVSLQLATRLYKGENIKTPLDNNQLPLQPRPQIVTGLFTTFKSQRITRKLNFDILNTISYSDLQHNGRSYASVLGNETKGVTIECKRLQSFLSIDRCNAVSITSV